MSCTINSDGSSTCCAPGGPCSTSSAPIGIPAPINDYRPTDTISKQFGNTCGPFPDNGACGEALTSFQGVITNNTSEDADGSTLFEVSWNMGPGTPTYPVFSYEHPNNIFLVNRGRYQPVNQNDISSVQSPNPFTKIEVIDTKTAGLGGSNIAMILIVGGFIYYAYSKGLLKK